MKKTTIALVALATASLGFAQEKSYSVTLDNTIASEYIFRGQEHADLTFMPSLEVKYEGFYARAAAFLPMDGTTVVRTNTAAQPWASSQINYTLGYSYALNDSWTVDAGATYYTYEGLGGSNANTFEPYIGVSTEVSGVTLSLYGFYDTYIDDLTLQVSAGYSLPIEAIGTSLDFTATVGFVNGDGVEGLSIVNDYWYYGIGVAVPYKLSDNATLTVGLDWTDVNENAINDGAELTFTAGITFGF